MASDDGSDSDIFIHSDDDDKEEKDYIIDKDTDFDINTVYIQEAGLEAVNGFYRQIGRFDHVGYYTRVAPWENQSHEFSLFRCNTSNGAKHWYISIVPLGAPPGTSLDIDFYSAPVSTEEPNYPPVNGWHTEEEGKDPPPNMLSSERLRMCEESTVKNVAAAYKEMLFSEENSDVKFVCPDGQAIPAHKCVLAASSPYFKALFSSRWEGTDKEEINTTFAAHIIKAMLTLLYTGKVYTKQIEEDLLGFMSIAHEYDLESLKIFIVLCYIGAIEASSLTDIWEVGLMYESDAIKKACIEFATRYPLSSIAHGWYCSKQFLPEHG